jgi:kinesin family protein 11
MLWFELCCLSNLVLSFFFVIGKRFNVSIEQMRGISDYTQGLLENLLNESKRLENHAMRTDEIQMRSIAEFQKAYEVVKKRF